MNSVGECCVVVRPAADIRTIVLEYSIVLSSYVQPNRCCDGMQMVGIHTKGTHDAGAAIEIYQSS